MGVDLGDIIPREKIELEDISGWRLAIDAYNALYQFLAIIRGASGEHLRDAKGRVTSHLSGLFYRTVNLLEIGIKPVYVFDGKPPEMKRLEVERRYARREQAAEEYQKALLRGDVEQARKYAEASTTLRREMVDDAKKLLDAMGVPWVDAPSEGEAQAAVMAQEGTVDAVGSQDHDSLIFGAPVLIRNVTISGKRRLPSKGIMVDVHPERIRLSDVLRSLDISREQLVDLAILIGTDFNPDGFYGIGPAKALKLIKRYNRLEEIVELRDEISKIDYNSIRSIFLNPPAIRNVSVKWGSPDREKIISFLVNEHSFSQERVSSAIERLIQVEKTRSESLEKWF
jgi:flap endonuclease-1